MRLFWYKYHINTPPFVFAKYCTEQCMCCIEYIVCCQDIWLNSCVNEVNTGIEFCNEVWDQMWLYMYSISKGI
jgi:hypothetical protein